MILTKLVQLSGNSQIRFLLILLAALISIITYSLQFKFPEAMGVIAMSLIISSTALVVGGLLGFLFGIPKTLQFKFKKNTPDVINESQNQDNSNVDNHERLLTTDNYISNTNDYIANTNLEQISDWLTKILVGVGLTQIPGLLKNLEDFGAFIAPAFFNKEGSSSFAIALVIFFSIYGFILAYLWTRLSLITLLRYSDVNSLKQTLQRELLQEVESREDVSARALALTRRQLEEAQEPESDKLLSAIKDAVPSVKVLIFHAAREARVKGLENNISHLQDTNINLIKRTIPIFKALIASDTQSVYHRNYGQLGFALKDNAMYDKNEDAFQKKLDFKEAEGYFDKAINIRDNAPGRNKERIHEWLTYELNRAICRMKIYTDDEGKQASIIEDLATFIHRRNINIQHFFEYEQNKEIKNWLSKNNGLKKLEEILSALAAS